MDYLCTVLNCAATNRHDIVSAPGQMLPIDSDTYRIVTADGRCHNWVIRFYSTVEQADRERLFLETCHQITDSVLTDIRASKILGYQRGPLFWNVITYPADGKPLDEYLTEHGPLAEAELRNIAAEVITTLRHIHERGLTHGHITAHSIIYGPTIELTVNHRPNQSVTADWSQLGNVLSLIGDQLDGNNWSKFLASLTNFSLRDPPWEQNWLHDITDG